ncbi:polysaccharide deacetylase family protein [Clostridium ganghwense]|uniref:Polysaccharide deacetylase family protein n=1 Tax=Clostridium ganghwense TaxID=312089 RepID=A0ABT4CR10_9CLOT|nr:polysaccharide deacetylase family protein [Clostridium ganghwense]MCY6371482.1 polysaccharide deacetylase family protein [Clostridium ganghwense]
MNSVIIALVILIGLSYAVIPTCYYRFFDKKIIKTMDKKDSIMLTFDDGPDERYTNTLLDLLKKNDVKASFFLVADKAKKNPNIVNRMIEEGHKIALHSYSHQNALFTGYWSVKRDFENSMKIMKENNWKVNYYRPPWGDINIFTLLFAKKNGLMPMLWSVMAEDWSRFSTVETIEKKLLKRVKEGSIICLHDSNGAEKAPERTIQALRTVLPILKEKYKFITLEDMT